MSKLRTLVAGHSHIACLTRAYETPGEWNNKANFSFLSFREEKFKSGSEPPAFPSAFKLDLLLPDFQTLARNSDFIVLCLNGNEHNNMGMFEIPALAFEDIEGQIRRRVLHTYTAWLKLLLDKLGKRVFLLLPPPPIESADYILGTEKAKLLGRPLKVREAKQRRQLWQAQCETIAEVARRFGLEVIHLPDDVFSSTGFLAEHCLNARDATHGNTAYGKRILQELTSFLMPSDADGTARKHGIKVRNHPYVALPDYCYWKQAISEVDPAAVDPVTQPRFKIRPKHKVATAGSCFAQHISKRLRESGYNFFLAEQAEGGEAEGRARGFYDFSARYGNVYTARQLVQLFDRAFGYFTPIERVWPRHGGGWCDPFRPRIEPEGYASEEAVIQDGKRHRMAVRRMFKRLDVFVFTLGLTECWVSRLDGAAYPMAPGVAGGEYDPAKHEFINFGVADVVADLKHFLAKLKLVNPKARVILTVSPVPLMATAEDRHVLISTTYSKSVLRVAAEEIVNSHDNVDYFPSYEIITGQHIGNAYYGPDRRSVTERGVDHVMGVFMSHMTEQGGGGTPGKATEAERLIAEIEALAEAACDEEMLAKQ